MNLNQTALPEDIHVFFKYSCSLELVCSLHVITDPTHHSNCMEWYGKIVGGVPNPLLLRIALFGHKYAQWTFVMDLFDYFSKDVTSKSPHYDNFYESLEAVRSCDDALFAYIFLGGFFLHDKDTAQKMIDNPEFVWDNSNKDLAKYIALEDVEYFVRNIAEVKSEMISILEEYYDCFFREFWKSTASYYKNALIMRERQSHHHFSLNQVLSLSPQISYSDGEIFIKKRGQYSLKPDKIEEFCFAFSIFTYPHLMFNIQDNRLTIYENLLIPNILTSLDTIAGMVKILGDSTRMVMIRMLSRYTLTNKELAKLLNVTPATVSQHLKILKNAGLLISNKQKQTIYYKLDNFEFQKILDMLQDYFRL